MGQGVAPLDGLPFCLARDVPECPYEGIDEHVVLPLARDVRSTVAQLLAIVAEAGQGEVIPTSVGLRATIQVMIATSAAPPATREAPLTEQGMAERARAGDPEAFRALYDAHHPRRP